MVDLGDLTTIKPAAEEFTRREQRLDVLWNNAGVMEPPKGSVTAQVRTSRSSASSSSSAAKSRKSSGAHRILSRSLGPRAAGRHQLPRPLPADPAAPSHTDADGRHGADEHGPSGVGRVAGDRCHLPVRRRRLRRAGGRQVPEPEDFLRREQGGKSVPGL